MHGMVCFSWIVSNLIRFLNYGWQLGYLLGCEVIRLFLLTVIWCIQHLWKFVVCWWNFDLVHVVGIELPL